MRSTLATVATTGDAATHHAPRPSQTIAEIAHLAGGVGTDRLQGAQRALGGRRFEESHVDRQSASLIITVVFDRADAPTDGRSETFGVDTPTNNAGWVQHAAMVVSAQRVAER